MSTGQNGKNGGAASPSVAEVIQPDEREFTTEEFQNAWDEFAERRKSFQAEYQLLRQPVECRKNEIVVQLHNPVQETILNTLKGEATAFLRKRLQNRSLTLRGELREIESRKMIYTSREKFEYLLEKYPALKELRDRLGLDTDFG